LTRASQAGIGSAQIRVTATRQPRTVPDPAWLSSVMDLSESILHRSK
jgi:hypothetical protein